MKYNPNSYVPHPVLRPHSTDYPDGVMGTSLSREMVDDDLIIKCDFNIEEPTILTQVENGNVACCILVYCSATCYTEVFRAAAGNTVVSATISTRDINGRIEVHPSVISFEVIALPTDTAHPEYSGNLMSVDKRKQLAASEPWSFVIKAAGKIESVFRLQRDSAEPSELEDWEFEFEADVSARYIVITSNAKTYNAFHGIRSRHDITRATIYLNALTTALPDLHEEPDENEPAEGWATTLRERLKELNLDNSDRHSYGFVAQRLLGTPFSYLSQLAETEVS